MHRPQDRNVLGVFKKQHGNQCGSRGRGRSAVQEAQRPLETESYVVTNSYSNLIPAGLSIIFA